MLNSPFNISVTSEASMVPPPSLNVKIKCDVSGVTWGVTCQTRWKSTEFCLPESSACRMVCKGYDKLYLHHWQGQGHWVQMKKLKNMKPKKRVVTSDLYPELSFPRVTDLVEWRARTYSWKSIVPLQSSSNTRKMDSARKTASSPSAVWQQHQAQCHEMMSYLRHLDKLLLGHLPIGTLSLEGFVEVHDGALLLSSLLHQDWNLTTKMRKYYWVLKISQLSF